MIGLRTGIKAGPRVGLAVGIGADELSASSSGVVVARDATSNIYVPASVAQYAELGIAAPISIWELQEASGTAEDSLGLADLSVTGSPTYAQTVAGWSRKAIEFTDGSSAQLTNVAGVLPNIASASFMALFYVRCGSSTTARNVVCLGVNATRGAAEFNATPRTIANSNGNLAVGASTPMGAVRPVLVKIDRTNSVMTLYTNQERLTPTWSASMAGSRIAIGSGGARLAATCGYLYGAAWDGADAEITNTQAKALLEALGWTIPWSP